MATSLTAVILVAAGCNECVVRGTVCDIQGEVIPGVAVTAGEDGGQTITDALGRYRIGHSPGTFELQFRKTGYTSGCLRFDAMEAGKAEARTVSLWCLPRTSGVFLFDNYQYRPAFTTEPKSFKASDGRLLYGSLCWPGIERTVNPEPVLVTFRVPNYDVKLSRLKSIEAAPMDMPANPQKVLVQDESLRVDAAPIDEPDERLWEIQLTQPLTPGLYAVHWGALDGYPNTDRRIFLFEIVDPAKSEVPAEVPEAADASAQEKTDEAEPEPAPSVDSEAHDAGDQPLN